MSNIDATLAERGSRYGEFTDHAEVTQAIKNAMADSNNWSRLGDDQREALEMVAHKVGRILNGDPDYIDSWTDIIGYTRLVEKRLIAEQAAAKALITEEGPCDDPHCPACQPANRISLVAAMAELSEMFGGAPKGPAPKTPAQAQPPSEDVVRAALKTLLTAGVIAHAA